MGSSRAGEKAAWKVSSQAEEKVNVLVEEMANEVAVEKAAYWDFLTVDVWAER